MTGRPTQAPLFAGPVRRDRTGPRPVRAGSWTGLPDLGRARLPPSSLRHALTYRSYGPVTAEPTP